MRLILFLLRRILLDGGNFLLSGTVSQISTISLTCWVGLFKSYMYITVHGCFSFLLLFPELLILRMVMLFCIQEDTLNHRIQITRIQG